MNDDLDKAEQEWANRSLFRPQRRRRGRWLWFAVLIASIAVVARYSEQLLQLQL